MNYLERSLLVVCQNDTVTIHGDATDGAVQTVAAILHRRVVDPDGNDVPTPPYVTAVLERLAGVYTPTGRYSD